MIDRNSPLSDQIRAASKNASNQDREYWAWLFKQSDAEIEKLRAALRDVIGMLDDPTGGEHVRDMRGAALIARAAIKDNPK